MSVKVNVFINTIQDVTTSCDASKFRPSTSTSDSEALSILSVTSAVDFEFINVGCCTTKTVC